MTWIDEIKTRRWLHYYRPQLDKNDMMTLFFKIADKKYSKMNKLLIIKTMTISNTYIILLTTRNSYNENITAKKSKRDDLPIATLILYYCMTLLRILSINIHFNTRKRFDWLTRISLVKFSFTNIYKETKITNKINCTFIKYRYIFKRT